MTPAISFVVNCKNQEEIDFYWEKLKADGGQPSRCGWLEDKFGVSWQVVPDQKKSDNAIKAMMTMVKLDLAELKAACES